MCMRNRNEIEAPKKSDFEHREEKKKGKNKTLQKTKKGKQHNEKDTCFLHNRAVGNLGLAVNPKR